MWLMTQLLRITIWLVDVISDNKDILITFFTSVKDLVSSLIYVNKSLLLYLVIRVFL